MKIRFVCFDKDKVGRLHTRSRARSFARLCARSFARSRARSHNHKYCDHSVHLRQG